MYELFVVLAAYSVFSFLLMLMLWTLAVKKGAIARPKYFFWIKQKAYVVWRAPFATAPLRAAIRFPSETAFGPSVTQVSSLLLGSTEFSVVQSARAEGSAPIGYTYNASPR